MSRVILYGNGLFGTDRAVNDQQLEYVRTSGFNTVILWTLHVHPEGTLMYNDAVIAKDGVFAATFNYLPSLLKGLLAPGSTVDTVLFCIGSAGADDFTTLQSLLTNSDPKAASHLRRNLTALQVALPLAGFDFDDEDALASSDVSTVAQLGLMLCGGNANIISYCPFNGYQTFWADCLSATYALDQTQRPPLPQTVQWMGIQTYGGGVVTNFVDAIEANNNASPPQPTGVSNPAAFVLPGYSAGTNSADGQMTPDQVQAAVASAVATNPDLPGAFIWNSGQVDASPFTLSQYAQAIIRGLAGKASG
jgi:hypothetical protein